MTNQLTFTINVDLVTGSTYRYRVLAQNEAGIGLPSNENVVVAARAPDAPTEFSLIASSGTSIVF